MQISIVYKNSPVQVSIQYKNSPAQVNIQYKGTPGRGLPVGGATDEVLTKNSAADFDYSWQSPQAVATIDDGYF